MSAIYAIKKMNYNDIAALVQQEVDRLGSQSKVAIRCDVSPATINLILNGKWDGVRENMWRKVAAALDWRPDDAWNIVETINTRRMHQLLDDAKRNRMWIAVSEMAGAGKTVGATTFMRKNPESIYYIEADEWNKGEFVKRFARSLGISHIGCTGYYDLLDKIVTEFQVKTKERPLIIIDQADKLRDAALRCLIPLFNGLEDRAGCVIMGVGHLNKRIKRQSELQTCGYDEILSRFGRRFVGLPGCVKNDVASICIANGIEDKDRINAIWKEVWEDEKTWMEEDGRRFKVIKDLRRLKTVIKRERLQLEPAASN